MYFLINNGGTLLVVKRHENIFAIVIRDNFWGYETAVAALAAIVHPRPAQGYRWFVADWLNVKERYCGLSGVHVNVRVREFNVRILREIVHFRWRRVSGDVSFINFNFVPKKFCFFFKSCRTVFFGLCKLGNIAQF